jgi:adenosylcobyric acid synthase
MKMIQVLGTSSSAGKTTLAMVLCRHISKLGFRVAPFKSVNMSLNSISLEDGSEISRSVWLQSISAGVPPEKEMNPFLLKPEGRGASQIIVLGKSLGVMSIASYRKYMRENAAQIIRDSIKKLEDSFDVIVAEGAGSPAEINLEGDDFANTFVSEINGSPCVLITDIDRGGSFASLYGTLELMRSPELVRWFVINRMSGDPSVLNTGIRKIESMTGKKCIGVVPKRLEMSVPGEDSLNYENPSVSSRRIAVIRYPHMENYSDVDPLTLRGIGFTYVTENNQDVLDSAELIILPGSKNVPMDLEYLRMTGISDRILKFAGSGKYMIVFLLALAAMVDASGDFLFSYVTGTNALAIGSALTALTPMAAAFIGGLLIYKDKLTDSQLVGFVIMVAGALVLSLA